VTIRLAESEATTLRRQRLQRASSGATKPLRQRDRHPAVAN